MKSSFRIVMIGILATIFFGGIVVFTPLSVQAQDPLPKDKNWEFNLAPLYLWAISMDGNMTVKGLSQPLDVDFGQITDNLEGVFTLHFEGMHKSGWGFLTDVNYVNLEGQQDTPGPLPLTIDVELTQVMAELAGLYRFSFGKNALDLIGGARYYAMDTKIDIVGAPPEVDEEKDWVDVMLGARYIWNIADKWSFIARGDIAFGGSDFAWNFAGLFNFQPWKHVSFLFGYRYMDIDYKDGSGADLFRYDVSMYGPLLALNFVW